MRTSTQRLALFLACTLPALLSTAQITFTNANNRLHSDAGVPGSNTNNRSGNSVTVVDVNNDGLDDIVRLDEIRYVRIEYQQPGGTFSYQYIGDFGPAAGPWGMSMADVDHNGYKDILMCGGSDVQLMKLNNTGTGVLGPITTLPNSNIFSQNGNFMDVNNDGWEDIFVCNDVNESRIWVNNGSGGFPAEANNTVIDFDVTPGSGAPNDESGNYSSVWTDFDNDGDVDFYVAHCRQGTPPGDIRRTDRLFVNNGNGTYTENAAAYNLNSNDQDWTASFGDIDNDGDFDLFQTKHDVASGYYINSGGGNFPVNPNGTLNFGSMPMQAIFEDFDNDGFVDLLISGDNDNRLYLNNGNSTFTDVTPPEFVSPGSNMLAFATGDLNHDGKIDLYSSYGTTYNNPGNYDDVYWLNSTNNNNHYITFALQGTSSTDGALGARIYLYGSWGVQTREVRASESYGTCNTFQLHFGLGSSTTIDSAVIDWPAAGSPNTVIINPAEDQFITVIEGDCVSPDNVITYTGQPVLCPGQSLTLTGPAGVGYTYLWSTGATTQSINVTNVGEYSVHVAVSGNNCSSHSGAITVELNPDETPIIAASAATEFCQGDSVTITSSPAQSYSWSNGDNTQSTVITQSGNYYVTIQGVCQAWNSDTIAVNVLPAPAPVGTDVYMPNVNDTIVTATGNNISWYDAATGGNLLGTGSSYVTPVIASTTTYYAEDSYTYGGGSAQLGKLYQQSSGGGFNGSGTNAHLIFDVLGNCTLNTVKVYTDTPGLRTIELRNSSGSVLQSATVNIPVDTSVVTLNFPLTPGSSYQLGTNDAQNNSSFGYISPRLMRSNTGVNYPYTANGLVSVHNSSAGTNFYYYFYDWQISLPTTVCTSTRTPVTVYVLNLGEEGNVVTDFNVFPNPAPGNVSVKFTAYAGVETLLSMTDMMGRKVMQMNLGNVEGEFVKTLSLEGISVGVYQLQVKAGEQVMQSLVVVE